MDLCHMVLSPAMTIALDVIKRSRKKKMAYCSTVCGNADWRNTTHPAGFPANAEGAVGLVPVDPRVYCAHFDNDQMAECSKDTPRVMGEARAAAALRLLHQKKVPTYAGDTGDVRHAFSIKDVDVNLQYMKTYQTVRRGDNGEQSGPRWNFRGLAEAMDGPSPDDPLNLLPPLLGGFKPKR